MNWRDITISQYQQAYEVCKLKPTTADEKLEQDVLIASALSGKTKEEVERMGRADWRKVKLMIAAMKEPPPQVELPRIIAIGWRRYRMLTTVNKATVGQLLFDLRMARTEEQMVMNLHKLVAAFVIHPWRKTIWWKLTGGGPDNVRIAEDMKNHCPFVVAYSIALFFCEVSKELSGNTLISLIESQIGEMEKLIGTSKATDGSRP